MSLLWVGLGGGLGAIARYKLGGMILHYTADWRFPLGTFVVNVLGCLIAGFLAELVEQQGILNAETRLFLFTGFLGGFTTFSAFSIETMSLLQRHEFLIAMSNIVTSVSVGLLALWLGMKTVH